MLHIVQLKAGCYKITIDFSQGTTHVHLERIMKPAESDAEPLEGGEELWLPLGGE